MNWIVISKKNNKKGLYELKLRIFAPKEITFYLKKLGMKNIKIYSGKLNGRKLDRLKDKHALYIADKK